MHAQAYAELKEEGDRNLLAKYIDDFGVIEDLVLEHKTIFKDGIYRFQPVRSGQQQMSNGGIEGLRLERVEILVFGGNYGDWVPFRELFRSMVHENPGLQNVQKMQYLRSNLKGEAERFISHLNVIEDNYETTWSLLCDRYDNMKIIAQELMQRWWDAGQCQSNHAAGLREMVNAINQLTASFKTLKIDGFDLATVFILNSKLDKESRAEWQKLISESTDVPTLSKLMTFLTQRFTMLETLALTKPCSESRSSKRAFTHTVQVSTDRCVMCNDQHRLFECQQFQKATVDVRREVVKNKRLGFNCLSNKHTVRQCQSKKSCKHCTKRHNTLLHTTDGKVFRSQRSEVPCPKTDNSQAQAHNALLCNSRILLATVLISVNNSEGKIVTLQALLDIGSQRSFVTEAAVQLLGLQRSHSKVSIGGIGCSDAVTTRVIVDIMASVGNGEHTAPLHFSAMILPKITTLLPAASISVALPTRIKKLGLADPDFNHPSRIDELLGADVYGNIIEHGFIRGNPCAQNTKLGWVLFGSTASTQNNASSTSLVAFEELEKAIKRFWEIEEPQATVKLSPDELQTENHFCRNTRRNTNGTYAVMLPFKDNTDRRNELKESVRIAHIRLRQVEQRLSSHPDRREEYHTFMKEYLTLVHMELVPDHLLQSTDCYYLLHHEVIKETSSTIKLRVVFNALQKTMGGKSLNDLLHVGSAIQNNLLHLLFRWRTYAYVMAADIEKMYRQIQVHESDRDYQRILWRFSDKEPVKHYRLKTVTYGTACAPFLAIRTLQQLAIDERDSHPEAAEALLQDFYVDDLLTGSDDLKHLKHLQDELTVTLRKGGFKMVSQPSRTAKSNPRV